MSKKDFYQLLGVTRTATADEIKKSYRKLAMQYHPDKNPNNKKAEEKFKEVTEAYETLSDPQKRQMYDQFGHGGPQQQQQYSGGNPFAGGAGPGGFGGFSSQNPDMQDIFGDVFGDIFNARQNSRPRRNARGSDLRYSLSITFEEAATGSEKVISFMRQRGGREEPAKLSVNVPAGVKDGQRLKLANEGDMPGNTGTPGDLYVIVHLADHLIFKREENDVMMDLPVNFADAILGTSLEIPTLTGKAILKVPEGTHTGQVFRLKGKGFPQVSGFGTGDMLIRVVIDTPDKITKADREMVEKLKEHLEPSPMIKNYNDKINQLLRTRK